MDPIKTRSRSQQPFNEFYIKDERFFSARVENDDEILGLTWTAIEYTVTAGREINFLESAAESAE